MGVTAFFQLKMLMPENGNLTRMCLIYISYHHPVICSPLHILCLFMNKIIELRSEGFTFFLQTKKIPKGVTIKN
jgi:hypothetical protein